MVTSAIAYRILPPTVEWAANQKSLSTRFAPTVEKPFACSLRRRCSEGLHTQARASALRWRALMNEAGMPSKPSAMAQPSSVTLDGASRAESAFSKLASMPNESERALIDTLFSQSNSTKMRCLQLRNFDFAPSFIERLAQALLEQHWPQLQGLELKQKLALSGHNEFGFDGMPIMRALQECSAPSAISGLSLENTRSADALCGEVAKLITAQKLPHLRLLNLPEARSVSETSADQTSAGIEALFDSLIAAQTPIPLRDLRLVGHRFDQASLNKLLQFLATPAADWLETLDLTDCKLSDIDLARLFWNLKAQSYDPVPLRQLSVAFNGFTSVAGTALAEAFSSGALRALEKLDLRCRPQVGQDNTPGAYENFFKGLTNNKTPLALRELYLQGVTISDEKMRSLAQAMKEEGPLARLQAVWMQDCCLSERTRGWLGGEPRLHAFFDGPVLAEPVQ